MPKRRFAERLENLRRLVKSSMLAMIKKQKNALRRAARTRSRIHGTIHYPRLCVKRSLKHIYVQLIDDDAGRTLASVSDKNVEKKGKPLDIAKEVGVLLAKKADSIGIKKAVFDRGAYRFHGRVAAIAEGARETGLII